MLMKDYFKHFYIMHFFSQNVYFTDSLVLHALKDILAKVKDKIFIISISVSLKCPCGLAYAEKLRFKISEHKSNFI